MLFIKKFFISFKYIKEVIILPIFNNWNIENTLQVISILVTSIFSFLAYLVLRKQSQIIKRQAESQELSIKISLYDRRKDAMSKIISLIDIYLAGKGVVNINDTFKDIWTANKYLFNDSDLDSLVSKIELLRYRILMTTGEIKEGFLYDLFDARGYVVDKFEKHLYLKNP